jgi:hypothetical protein
VFDPLFEGRVSVYVALAAAGVVLLLAWWNSRRRHWLFGLGAVVVLAGLYFLLDRLVETDREQIERKVEEMAAAVRARNTAAIMAHVSDQLHRGGRDKAAFGQSVERAIRLVDAVIVWEFVFPDDFRRPSGVSAGGQARTPEVARVGFRAKPLGGQIRDNPGFNCEAQFVRDPDGQWRLLDFQVFDPLTQERVEIPGV